MIEPLAFDGIVRRIGSAAHGETALNRAFRAQARFHHSGQRAFYRSPRPRAAAVAVSTYTKSGDPPPVIPAHRQTARLVDLRDRDTCRALGLAPDTPSPRRNPDPAAVRPATRWRASDCARLPSADGMLYDVSGPLDRPWHPILSPLNIPGGARIVPDGPARSKPGTLDVSPDTLPDSAYSGGDAA